jgi:hypothetical protein
MKQSNYLRTMELFPGSDIVRRFTFKAMDPRDSYALLARANHNLAMDSSPSREKSVFFQINDCFECLSPHKTAA